MNKHQIKGTLHLKGAATELAGRAEKAYGHAKSGMKREMRKSRERSRDRSIERHAH